MQTSLKLYYGTGSPFFRKRLSLCVCLLLGVLGLPAQPGPEQVRYEYTAKVVCGAQKSTKSLRLARGIYATTINIHNPNRETQIFFKKLALTFPPGFQAPGKIYAIGNDSLRYDEALQSSCDDLRERLFPNGFPNGYIEGYLVIQSRRSLDVTGVYSVAKIASIFSPQRVVSMDVEQIKERAWQRDPGNPPMGMPDLIPVPRPNCNPSGSPLCFCRLKNDSLIVVVRNQGNAPAQQEFKTQVDYNNGSFTQSIPAGLAPGAEHTLLFPIPAGCFTPDCSFRIRVDVSQNVPESNELNNNASGRCPG